MLQTTRLSKNTLINIHTPIIGLAKRKIEVIRSVRNSMMYHRNLGNLNSLWDQLLLKQITSLHNRLNTAGPEEAVTNIRIEDGFHLIGASKNMWQENIPEASAKL
jgi:hypothetical protein